MGVEQRRNRPDTIPSNPHIAYAGKGWVSWPDWLGYDKEMRVARDACTLWCGCLGFQCRRGASSIRPLKG